MFKHEIRKDVGEAIPQKLRDKVAEVGVDVVKRPYQAGSMLRSVIDDLQPMDCMYEIEQLQSAQCRGLIGNLTALAGKLPEPYLFEQIMRPMALGPSRVPYEVARWIVETWANAIGLSLPDAGLKFDQPGQDRAAYLALMKANYPPLEKIEAKIKERFGIQLASTKIRRRQGGSRVRGRGWYLQYSFGRAADSREYLDWSYGHRMTNTEYGRVYEDGEEVSQGVSNF